MNKFLTLLAFVFVGSFFTANIFAEELDADAKTSLSKELKLRSSYEKTVSWIENNKKTIQSQSGFDSVKDLGDGKFKITKDTPRGVFVWTIKETEVKKDGKCYFKSTMINCEQGGIVYSDSEIVVSPSGNGCHVEINAKVGVTHPRVRSPQLKIDTNIHLNAMKRLLEENVR